MRQIFTKDYPGAGLKSFADANEVWSYYKNKGTPEQRERLKKMLRLTDPQQSVAEPIRRRA